MIKQISRKKLYFILLSSLGWSVIAYSLTQFGIGGKKQTFWLLWWKRQWLYVDTRRVCLLRNEMTKSRILTMFVNVFGDITISKNNNLHAILLCRIPYNSRTSTTIYHCKYELKKKNHCKPFLSFLFFFGICFRSTYERPGVTFWVYNFI